MQNQTINLQDLKVKTFQVNGTDDGNNNSTTLNDGGYTWVG